MEKIIQPHEWTNADGEIIILKCIPKTRETKKGFKWPEGIGSKVLCPDWNDTATCGGGLHGWPWGFGLGEGMDYDILEDIWLVIGAKPENVVGELDKGLKCKLKTGTIHFEGSFKAAWDIVSSEHTRIIQNLAASGNDSKLAASGYASNLAASGNDSKLAASGDVSKLAASGNDSKLAASGNDSKLAASGYASNLAASGNDSKLAASGYASKLAASGNDSVCAIAANRGRVKIGERGAFAIAHWNDKTGWGFVVGKVGKKGIKAGVWYEVENGQLIKCKEQ